MKVIVTAGLAAASLFPELPATETAVGTVSEDG